jgi:hypothetical protein
VGGRDVQAQLGDEPGEARRLTFRQVEDEPRQRGRVDDRMLERAFQPSPHQPRVKSVVAVLDEDRPLREAQKPAPGVLELRGADEHRAVDVMAFARVGIDRGSTVHERVEERQRAIQAEAFRADLEDQEWSVARRLHVEGDELGLVE